MAGGCGISGGTLAGWRKGSAESEGSCTHLDSLGVLLQPLINLGDGQGWLGLPHTVTGGEKGLGPGALTQLPGLTLSSRHSSLGPQISTSWTPSSAFPWRTLGPASPGEPGSCLGSSQTYLFLMERFRDSVLSLSCGGQAEMEPLKSERGPEPLPRSCSPCVPPPPQSLCPAYAHHRPCRTPHSRQSTACAGQKTKPWCLTYFGAGAQGRRAHFSPLRDQGAGCPGLLAALVLGQNIQG